MSYTRPGVPCVARSACGDAAGTPDPRERSVFPLSHVPSAYALASRAALLSDARPTAGPTAPVRVRINPRDTMILKLVEGQPNWLHPRGRLARALLADEFVLFGQPIVALQSARHVEFVEVLVRLREEEEQCLPPGGFIPSLAQHGMMPEFDRWVVRHAARWLAARGVAESPGLFLNVARDTLADRTFPASVLRTLEYTGVSASRLCFEVPEREAAKEPDVMLAAARSLRALGCRVALASCGREPGHFAPRLLAECSFVKIHGGLIHDAENDVAAAAWLVALSAASHAAGARIIAEYVESESLLGALYAIGASLAQGIAFGVPVPIDGLPGLVR